VLDGLAESTAGLGVDLGELEDVDAMAEADAAVAAEGETAEDATGA
jgi:small subunit ribosomal protein S2